MTDRVTNFIAAHGQALEAALARWLPFSNRVGAELLNEALRYAVFPGGKRLRPMLTLMGTRLVEGDVQKALPAACAVEFLHTSSLILDDLPTMDDADLRRCRPTAHMVFGEGIALLSALALFNEAYALLTRVAYQSGTLESVETLMAEVARCLGADGMIGGQMIDLAPRRAARPESLAGRNLKTTALMRLAMVAGAVGCGASEADITALARFGERLGIVYQVRDDLLDESGGGELTDKPARQDARHRRLTFVTELGVEGARRQALAMAEDGKSAILERFGACHEAGLLIDVIEQSLTGVVKPSLATDMVG